MPRTALLLLIVLFLTACATRPARLPVAKVTLPPYGATAAVDYPGLPHVVTYTDGLYSGAAPDGEAGFATLAGMGVKTIISVDGALPDVATAQRYGLRYVHLPITYSGMDRARTQEIARAVRDLPGPVYLHCHHGKHRSAAASGAAAVTLGKLSREQALALMKVSGTSPSYPGLFQCVQVASVASAAELAAARADFPARSRPAGLVATMAALDETVEALQTSERAGWEVPAAQPDLVPAAEAGKLADLLRHLQQNPRVQTQPDDFRQRLAAAAEHATALETALVSHQPPATLSARFKQLNQSCSACHTQYRNQRQTDAGPF